eukprot:TRINITY_DN7787_c0_g1_i1.p1 TRINITY_DN7787_c0_g1~~TRINITY_DN7787_c0_g1_i1.p1  ORF type:complete len:547 (+),score=100.52 TRINITY_DN7787_c0_g1_i1:53-1642(+)
MKQAFILLLLTVGVTMGNGVNGGSDCVACTCIAAIQLQRKEEDLEKLCKKGPEGDLCRDFLIALKDALRKEGATPDTACLDLKFCNMETGEFCHLYPSPPKPPVTRDFPVVNAEPELCNSTVFEPICNLINNFANNHRAIEDIDGDGFSTIQTFRGSSWKGKDCSDIDKNIHPGRDSDGEFFIDSNCNGITNGEEDRLCKNTNKMGVISLGDSATAHFHIPAGWFEPDVLNFNHTRFAVENELDWPHFSWGTGHLNATWNGTITGPVDSLYLRMFGLNRCNHRDYQNIGVNGARAHAMNDIVKSMSRVRGMDSPALVTLSLIGNDVCNGHPDTVAHMTKPADFAKYMAATVEYLDQVLPVGSSVYTTGLVDGRILYDNMADRVHPISHVDHVVKYKDLYTYLNCLQISPCTGWMNTNATLRNVTTERATQLNTAWREEVPKLNLSNIRVAYMDYPLKAAVAEWNAQGGQTWELIEPVDGFHPNQIANSLFAQQIWKQLLQINSTQPGFIPSENPHNSEILAKFGDQGGY